MINAANVPGPDGLTAAECTGESDEYKAAKYAGLDRIQEALERVRDPGTEVDTGAGFGSRDFWVKIHGIEFYVEVKLSLVEQAERKKIADAS